MSVYERIAEQLRQARGQVPSSPLAEAADAVEQLQRILVELGSDSDEIREAWQHVERSAELVERARQAATAIDAGIDAYLAGLGGGASSGEPAGQTPARPQPASKPAAPAAQYPTARDGSQYPDAAASIVDLLPRRVRAGEQGEKTVGFVDGSATEQFTSGTDGTWSTEIEKRSAVVGIPPQLALILRSHVEMKVATKMVQQGKQHSELVINHVPCGSQPYQWPGCAQALERYLPSGYTLTVHGTTQQGTAQTFIYKGSA